MRARHVSGLTRLYPTAPASIAATLLLAILPGCGGGGGGGSSSSGGTPSISSVSISGPVYTEGGLCSTFTATVSGTGNYEHSVQWYVNGIQGGSSADGLISSGGSYCAPSQLPTTNPLSIKAVANGDTTKSGSIDTRVVEITVSPSQVQLFTGGTQQFTATVAGALNNNAVIWEVNGIAGGNSSVGTISATGFYTAPTSFTNAGIMVEAALTEAQTVYASVNLSLSEQILISPSNPQLTYGSTQQFTATINGVPSQVNWAASYGSISSSGLYTANGTQTPDTIRAWTTNANGTITVRILGQTPTITAISPQPATVLDQIMITGTNLNPIATVLFPNAIGGQIPATAIAVSTADGLKVSVPQGAVSGPLYVTTQQGTLTPIKSNTLQFQRLARLRIRTPRKDLSAGESVTLQYALLGDSTPRTVTFTSDVGTFSGSSYLAPATLANDSFAHIQGCIAGTTSCDKLIIALHPFRIAPDVPLVALGQPLQLSAYLGSGTTGANWSLLNGGGSINSNGLYTAGTGIQNGGPASISAVSSGATEPVFVGVTGAFPGLLNRVYDYVDQNDPNATGTYINGMTIVGNRLYVSATNYLGGNTNSYFWIDIYDTTDSLHPAWVTAVESNSAGALFSVGNYLYSYDGTDLAVPGYPNTITLYSLQNGVPILKSQTSIPLIWNIAWNQGILTLVPNNGTGPTNGTQEILMYDLTGGTIVTTDLILPLPPNANTFIADTTLRVGNRLFMSVSNNDLTTGGTVLTYDLTTSPPTLLGGINSRSLRFYSSGNFLFGALGGMDIYDISSQLPQLQGHVDGINAQQLNGTQVLADTGQQGCQMVDISNPQSPKVTSIFFDGVITGCDEPMVVGNRVYASEYVGGLAIFDASQTGGPVIQNLIYGGPHLTVTAYDLLAQSTYLYAATSTFDGAVLSIYDNTTATPTRLGEYLDSTQAGYSVQTSGNYAYFGMSVNTAVLNISQPASPTLVGTLPIPAISLARSNNTLYAGSSQKSLLVVDISNPAQPTISSIIALPDLPLKMRTVGNLLFVADATGGLFIYNVSTPSLPVLLSQTTGFTAVNDVAVSGTTAFVAADIDGLGILDISNPAKPTLISKTPLSRIDPFYNDNPPNEASSVAVNNGVVFVGTINDNGLVFGLDCTRLTSPRIVSLYAYGDFILTWSGTLLFNGNSLLVGGSLNSSVYAIAKVDLSHPYDNINQDFPPQALQKPAPLGTVRRASGFSRPVRKTAGDPRFSKLVPDAK